MKRTLSIILSLLMVLSLFTGLNISASEIDTTAADATALSAGEGELAPTEDEEYVPDPFFIPIYALEDELLPEDAAEEDFVAIMDEVASLVQTIPEYVQGTLTVSDDRVNWEASDGTPYVYYPYFRALNRPGEKAGSNDEGESGVYDYSTGEEIYSSDEDADLMPSNRKGDADLAATGAYYNGPMSRHIAVIEPEYGQPGDFTCDGQPLEEKGKKLAKYTGGSYIYATGKKVTIDYIITAIKSCGVVMINTHGNINTFQIRNKEGLAGHGGWSKDGDDIYLIGSECLDEMLGDYICPNNFVMLAACKCMSHNGFANVLLNHGVAAVYGLSQSINHYGDLDYAKEICERLDDGKTLSMAISGTKRDKGYFDPYKYQLRSYDADVAEAFGSSTDFSAPRVLYKTYAKYYYHDIDENSLSWNPWAEYCSDFLKQRRPDVDPYYWENLKAISDAFKKVINDYPKKKKYAFPIIVSAEDPYPDDPDSVQDVHTNWRLPKKNEDIGFGDSQAEVVHKTLMYNVEDYYSVPTNKTRITLPLPDYTSQGYHVQFVQIFNDTEKPYFMYWLDTGKKRDPVLQLDSGYSLVPGLYGAAFQVRYWNYAEAKYIYKIVCYHILFYRENRYIQKSQFNITADGTNEQTINLKDIRYSDSKYFRTITFLGSPPTGMRLYGGWGDDEWQGFRIVTPDADKAPYLKGIAATPGSYYVQYQIFETDGTMQYYDVRVNVNPKKTVTDTMSVNMTDGSLKKVPIKVKVDNTDKSNNITSVTLSRSDNSKLPDGIDYGEENGEFYLYGTLDNPCAGKQHRFTLEVTLDDGTLVKLQVTLTEPCRVTFDLNGHGTGLPRDQWIALNGRINKPIDPSVSTHPRTFTGFYIFTGWYTDEECTERFDFYTVLDADYLSNVSGCLTLYAGWEEYKGVEVFGWKKSASEGSSRMNLSDITQEDYISFDSQIREGYTFKGWSANGQMTEVVSKFSDCLASQSGKQKLSAYTCFTKNPTNIVLDLPESAMPGGVIELKASLEPWDAQADITWTVSSPYASISNGKLYISEDAGFKDEIEVTAEALGKSASAVIYLTPEERFLRITDRKNSTEVEVTEADSDILGNGVFSFDGDHRLTISGEGVTLEDITIDADFDKGLDIVVEGDVTFIVRDDPVLNLSGDVTVKGGGAMHITSVKKSTAEELISFMGTGITLTVADVTLTAEGRANGICSVKGVNTLKICSANLDIHSTEGFAIIGLSGGVELTDCELDGGDGVLIGADGVYRDADNPASHAVIKPTAGEKVTLSGTVYYPSGEPMGNTMLRIAGQVTKTDAFGRYTLKNIPAGEHVMEISEPSGFTVDKIVEVTPSAPADPENPQQEPVANAEIKPFESALVTFMPGYGEGESYTVEVAYNETLELPECTFTAPEGMVFDAWDLGYPGDYIEIDGDMTAIAMFKNDGHVHHMRYIEGTDADCEHGGTLSAYYCEACDKYFLTPDGSIEISSDLSVEPLGHIWELVDWTWANDYSTAWANFVCRADNSHTITIEAEDVMHIDGTEITTDFTDKITSLTEHYAYVNVQGEFYDDFVQEYVTEKHFVDFDLDGHGVTIDDTEPIRITNGSRITRPADPAASGWIFEGWYADAERTEEFDFNAPILKDTIVYGKWSENTPILGDIDGDGEVTAIDVTYVQRHCAKLKVDIDEKLLMNADVDGNGILEITDATYIQRWLARMDIPYTIGEAIS